MRAASRSCPPLTASAARASSATARFAPRPAIWRSSSDASVAFSPRRRLVAGALRVRFALSTTGAPRSGPRRTLRSAGLRLARARLRARRGSGSAGSGTGSRCASGCDRRCSSTSACCRAPVVGPGRRPPAGRHASPPGCCAARPLPRGTPAGDDRGAPRAGPGLRSRAHRDDRPTVRPSAARPNAPPEPRPADDRLVAARPATAAARARRPTGARRSRSRRGTAATRRARLSPLPAQVGTARPARRRPAASRCGRLASVRAACRASSSRRPLRGGSATSRPVVGGASRYRSRERDDARLEGRASSSKEPAASYSPRGSTPKYHRRGRA